MVALQFTRTDWRLQSWAFKPNPFALLVCRQEFNACLRQGQVVLQAGGKIERMNAALTGASDGRTVVLTIKPTELLSGTMTASGTLEGSVLHLTGGGYGTNLNLALVKSDEGEFRTLLATLTERSNEIIADRVRREAVERQSKLQTDQLAHLQGLTERVAAFPPRADAVLGRLSPIEQQYEAITAQVQNYLTQDRMLRFLPDPYATRGRLSVAMNQGTNATDQLHNGVQSVQNDFTMNIVPLMKMVAEAQQFCQRAMSPPGDIRTACLNLNRAAAQFAQKFKAVADLLNRLEDTYQRELRKQQQFVLETSR